MRLNNLDGKEWVRRTKSVWMSSETASNLYKEREKFMEMQVLMSVAPRRDSLKLNHPATFSEEDVKKLIEFFTMPGDLVLDPFLGSGTVAVVCRDINRRCIGIELYPEWLEIARKRLGLFNEGIKLIQGNSIEVLKRIDSESVDYIITSPPYWGILNKLDHKAKRERVQRNLKTNYGYHENDLSLVEDYHEFLNILEDHFREYYRILKKGKYTSIVVADFRHKEKYYMFHADIGTKLEKVGFTLQGLIILVQNNKHLYPYGYPSTFVPNINNQFVLVAKKHEL